MRNRYGNRNINTRTNGNRKPEIGHSNIKTLTNGKRRPEN